MKRKLYIILFAALYICTAIVSTVHAVSFFQLANVMWMGVMLAATFEIGQAAVLFSLLNSNKERSKIMPWILMTILTAVQVMGNVFSSYKYLMLHSSDSIRYFTEPILFFMEPGDPMINVILTYIVGAILPVVALCMTGMISNYVEDNKSSTMESNKDTYIEDNKSLTMEPGKDSYVEDEPSPAEEIPGPEESVQHPEEQSADTSNTPESPRDNDLLRDVIFK